MSDDEDDTSSDFAGPGSKLGGLFGGMSSQQPAAAGSQSFKWKPPEKKKHTADSTTSVAATSVGAGEDLVLESAMVRIFQDQQLRGVVRCSIRATPQKGQRPFTTLLFTDQSNQKLLEIQLCSTTYWMQQPYDGQQQYVTIQDAQGAWWSLQFKKPDDATQFTRVVYSVIYSLSLFDLESPAASKFDVMSGDGNEVAHGDMVGVRYQTYRLEPFDKCPCLLRPAAGPPLEEIPEGDTKKVKLAEGGSRGVMIGMHDQLIGTSKGQRRYIALRAEEMLISDTMARPAGVADTDVLLCHVEVVKVKAGNAKNAESLPNLAAASAASIPQDAGAQQQQFAASAASIASHASAAQSMAGSAASISHASLAQSSNALVVVEQPPAQPAVPEPAAAPAAAPAPAPAAAPVAAAAPVLDTNTLLTTLLVKQLGGEAAQPKPEASQRSDLDDLQKGMDRLMVQMGQLYQKIDHIDVTRKLDENNEKIENVFRRVLGKAPSRGYDPYQTGIDRECEDIPTLLAEVEKRDKKIEELTESYHNALSSISDVKGESTSLKTDLQIERQTAIDRLTEAAERHRLQVVEMDAKHRTELDRACDRARREGFEEGHKQGVTEGEREAFLKQAGGSTDELLEQLQAARDENTSLQSELLGLNQKLLDERKQHDEQISLLNTLVKKYEDREGAPAAPGSSEAVNTARDEAGTLVVRSLKGIMNNLYFKLEEELVPQDGSVEAPIPASQVLQTATKVIKVCTKQALATLKQDLDLAGRQAAAQPAAAPQVPPPPPPAEASAAAPELSLPQLPSVSSDLAPSPPPPP